MSRTVVVLGGGVGGLSTAEALRQRLPGSDRIVLIDRAFDGVLGLSLLWVLRGWRTPEQVRIRTTGAALPGVDLRTASVDRIDITGRTVHTSTGPVGYDALIIALGADLDTAALPGLQDALDCGVAGEFYTLDGAAGLHQQIEDIDHGRIAVLVAGLPFKCPAAPFEAAFLIACQLGDKHTGGTVQVDTYTPDPLPMPVAGPDVGKALVGMLEAKQIGFHPGKSVTGVTAASRNLIFADGTTQQFDLLVVVPPHVPSAAARSTGLGPNGWIPVDPRTLATTAEGVWALGDTTALTLPNGKPLPKAAVFAEGEAEVIADGVARFFGYDAPQPFFTGEGACYVEVGGHQAAKGAGTFLEPPAPVVTLHEPSPAFHDEKADQEASWLDRWNR